MDYGRTPSGTRFAPLDRITPEDVYRRQRSYRNGGVPRPERGEGFVVTPLHVDAMIYGRTQCNRIVALNANTGQERWFRRAGAW
ncbi:hypothetical protein FJP65_05700 [Stenotrophomonas maltophilia]|nr:hypothetical protein FJP65_05700 [Stenotrophomonas maltophilia]